MDLKQSFQLNEDFIDKYKNEPAPFTPLGYVVYKRSYSRPFFNEAGKVIRTEEWWETVKRVVEGTYTIQKSHCKKLKLPWYDNKAQKSAQEMYRLIFEMKFLPPGRGLWMMGTQYAFERGGASLNNCGFTSTQSLSIDFSDPFCFLMDMSMLGVGIGGDTKGAGTIKIREPWLGTDIHTVPDTREGWVDLVRRLLDAYIGKGNLPKEIDFSLIRPYGVPIKGFGGTASGPGPLLKLVYDIHSILSPLKNNYITSTAIVDLFNAIGRCVVSGNVRRSAEIMFGDPSDEEFLSLKDPDKNKVLLSEWRWASNNSIFAEVGMDYTNAANRAAKNGEPGFEWLKNAQDYGRMIDPPDYKDSKAAGGNPCLEQTLEDRELCCLVESYPARHETYEEYERTLKFAYLYAKTVTLLPTHNERTNAVLLRNRRIGTSQSGIVQSFSKLSLRHHLQWSDNGYKYLRALDRKYSEWLCIPSSIKITSVKPSGSVSLLSGATPGIHYPHAEYYWRTVRIDSTSDIVKSLRKSNYRIEIDKSTPNTSIVYFPIKEENFSRGKSEVSMWEQLEIAAQMQAYWADNQVSVTITFKPEEAKDIKRALELYETRLKSVSFLPLADHGYEHAPYQTITKEEYEEAIKNLLPLDLSNTKQTEGDVPAYCDADGVCAIPVKDTTNST